MKYVVISMKCLLPLILLGVVAFGIRWYMKETSNQLLADALEKLKAMVAGECNALCPCSMCGEIWEVIRMLEREEVGDE